MAYLSIKTYLFSIPQNILFNECHCGTSGDMYILTIRCVW